MFAAAANDCRYADSAQHYNYHYNYYDDDHSFSQGFENTFFLFTCIKMADYLKLEKLFQLLSSIFFFCF